MADPMFSYATESSWAIECTLEAAGFSNALVRSLFEGTIKAQVKFPGKSVDDKEVFPTVLVPEEVYNKFKASAGPDSTEHSGSHQDFSTGIDEVMASIDWPR